MKRDIISGSGIDNQTDQKTRGNTDARLTDDTTGTTSQDKDTGNEGICLFDIGSACVDKTVMQSLLGLLNSICKCTTIGPQDIGYEEAERLIRDRLTIK